MVKPGYRCSKLPFSDMFNSLVNILSSVILPAQAILKYDNF